MSKPSQFRMESMERGEALSETFKLNRLKRSSFGGTTEEKIEGRNSAIARREQEEIYQGAYDKKPFYQV